MLSTSYRRHPRRHPRPWPIEVDDIDDVCLLFLAKYIVQWHKIAFEV